jgi:hypothetical protein
MDTSTTCTPRARNGVRPREDGVRTLVLSSCFGHSHSSSPSLDGQGRCAANARPFRTRGAIVDRGESRRPQGGWCGERRAFIARTSIGGLGEKTGTGTVNGRRVSVRPPEGVGVRIECDDLGRRAAPEPCSGASALPRNRRIPPNLCSAGPWPRVPAQRLRAGSSSVGRAPAL